ncbi:MAG: hypothetical protein WEA10_05815 [Actinomycetota bacterium]
MFIVCVIAVLAGSCSGEDPECVDAPVAVVVDAGFPPESARFAAVSGGPGAWFVGVPADLVSVEPDVAVFATDTDPTAATFEGELLAANDLAAGTSGEPVASDAFDGSSGVEDAIACVHRRTADLDG